MKSKLIGRDAEYKQLTSYINSDVSEFIAVYGRRRVGKTFLIRQIADDHFAFFVTGVHGVPKNEQLINFGLAIQKYFHTPHLSIQKNWILAFYELSRHLESLPDGKKIIFIDELPWMDTAKSGFVAALEIFWNSWALLRMDIKLIVCGSATSWMIDNLIHSRGGLHNHLTHRLVLEPFSLKECESYFQAYGFSYSRKQIAECYMVMGGIPYYMSLMDKSKSVAQNIDDLFFSKNAALGEEFHDLYEALFKNAAPHIKVVTALATKTKGLTRQEIVEATNITDDGALSTVLEELKKCGLTRTYEPFKMVAKTTGQRRKKDALFQLIDFYTLFYLQFLKQNQYHDNHFGSSSLNSPVHNSWAGYAFERLCLSHLPQIKQALGISRVQTAACSWRSTSHSAQGAQIDLLIDRRDETVNICKMKYAQGEFEIDKNYERVLEEKMSVFIRETNTHKNLSITMITTYGIKKKSHSGGIQCQVVLNDLFA